MQWIGSYKATEALNLLGFYMRVSTVHYDLSSQCRNSNQVILSSIRTKKNLLNSLFHIDLSSSDIV